jgi:hypothetical protein
MPEAVNVPLYLNWSFWAVLVAFVALVLSQLPPVHMLLKRASLDMELYSRIHITHKIGNPNIQLHLILNNVGGRTVKIKGVTSVIKRDGQQIAVLPAQNYLQNPGDKMPVLFTSFSLKPKEEWAHILNFLNYFSRKDEKKYRSAEVNLKADIIEKKKAPGAEKILVEADAQYVTPFIEMFNEKYLWFAGEYEIRVSVDAVPKGANVEKVYRFTLFESDAEELSKIQDQYRYGSGIYFDSPDYSGVIAQIVEA